MKLNRNQFNSLKKNLQPKDIYLDEGIYRMIDEESHSEGYIIIYSGSISQRSKMILGDYYNETQYDDSDPEFYFDKLEVLTEDYEPIEITDQQYYELVETLTNSLYIY